MTEKLQYDGGPIEHEPPTEQVVTVEFVKGLEPLDSKGGTNEAVAVFLANKFVMLDVHSHQFRHLPEWDLFNACSIDVRLRVFELMQTIESRVTTMLADDLAYTKERIRRVIHYIAEHQVAPSLEDVAYFAIQLASFEAESIRHCNVVIQEDLAADEDDGTGEMRTAMLRQMVSMAYAANISSSVLLQCYTDACNQYHIMPYSLSTLKDSLHSLGIDDPNW